MTEGVRGDTCRIAVTECHDSAGAFFRAPAPGHPGEQGHDPRNGEQRGRRGRPLHPDLGQCGRDQGEGTHQVGTDRGDPGRHRPAQRVADQVDGTALPGVEEADHRAGVAGDRVVAVVGRRGVPETGQVERLTVHHVLEQRHQRGPVLRGSAEPVHEESGRQPGPLRRPRTDGQRQPGQRDGAKPLPLGDPDGAHRGGHRCGGGTDSRQLGRRHAAMLRDDHTVVHVFAVTDRMAASGGSS